MACGPRTLVRTVPAAMRSLTPQGPQAVPAWTPTSSGGLWGRGDEIQLGEALQLLGRSCVGLRQGAEDRSFLSCSSFPRKKKKRGTMGGLG